MYILQSLIYKGTKTYIIVFFEMLFNTRFATQISGILFAYKANNLIIITNCHIS